MRLLIVLPSWVGDAVMATPSLRALREHLPGAFIGGLMRPGMDQLLAGCSFFDELHVASAQGMMGPKRTAAKLRARRYDAAVLFTNSFSTALTTRLAGIPRRLGYDRDARAVLLTDPVRPLRRRDVQPYARSATNPGDWAPVPACTYYYKLVMEFFSESGIDPGPMGPLELVATRGEELEASDLLARAGVTLDGDQATPLAVLNPGGNDPAKRWPADRFASLADYLVSHHGLTVLVSGAPSEAELVESIVGACRQRGDPARVVNMARLGITLSTLKPIVARARVMVTNDTGPRHIAAAFGTPVVTLFGPTDHRWTTIPHEDEVRLLADPTLPEEEVANDHAERCRVDRIGLGDVVNAVNQLLRGTPPGGV